MKGIIMDLDKEIRVAQIELNSHIQQANVIKKYLDNLIALKNECHIAIEEELGEDTVTQE